MTRIKCPSEDWDTHTEQEEREACPHDSELLEKLDAYGHITYAVGFSDEDEDEDTGRGDWLACFDFYIHEDPDGVLRIAYHVVVDSDSGGFIDTPESGVVSVEQAPFNLPAQYLDVGMGFGTVWTDQELADAQACNERWNADISKAITKKGQ